MLPLKSFKFDEGLHEQAAGVAKDILNCPLAFSNESVNLARAYRDLLRRRGLPPKTWRCYPSIQLASGAYFDYLDPSNSPMLPIDIANSLSKIARSGGHSTGVLPYTVAQHCVLAAKAAPWGFKFEALMHDAPEFVTGDMMTPLKQLLPDFMNIEERITHAMNVRYCLPLEMSPEVKEVDIRMACTEKRDVMPPDAPGEGWDSLDGIEPYGFEVRPWPTHFARDRWLSYFVVFFTQHFDKLCQDASEQEVIDLTNHFSFIDIGAITKTMLHEKHHE